MSKQGKRMRNIYKNLESAKEYDLQTAVELLKQNANTKFNESVDIALNLNIDTRKADQNIRGMITLPHGNGKSVRVAAIVEEALVQVAKDAGADIAGSEDLIDEIKNGKLDFDRCIATPSMMPKIGKISRILGPKGLMPNPKLGTVTKDITPAIKAAKAGQIEYRAEKAGILHTGVGRVSFEANKLVENVQSFVTTLSKTRPSSVKGTYMTALNISSTMGPGIKVAIKSILA